MPRPEDRLQIDICKYIRDNYPDVQFISEPSGLRVSPGMASKLKKMRSAHTHLDLYILETKLDKLGRIKYAGLVLELKARNIYKKEGKLYSDSHLRDQQRTIKALTKKGYKSQFVCSFDEAIKTINKYLN
jgi:hypothetical protein